MEIRNSKLDIQRKNVECPTPNIQCSTAGPLGTQGKGLWGGRLISFDSLPSTNQWALDNAGNCKHGDVIWALRQTAGRGRFQRKWLSPADRCLTVSIVLKCSTDTFPIVQIAALGIRSALERYSIEAMVKWPNDVLVNNRKIAGILAENESQTGTLVLGIGLNVNLTVEDLASVEMLQPATSMAIEKERLFDIEGVCAELLSRLQETIDATRECATLIVDTWQHYDCLTEKRIQVETGQDIICGKYAGVDESGRLRLIDDSGTEHLFWSGDVSLNTSESISVG